MVNSLYECIYKYDMALISVPCLGLVWMGSILSCI